MILTAVIVPYCTITKFHLKTTGLKYFTTSFQYVLHKVAKYSFYFALGK